MNKIVFIYYKTCYNSINGDTLNVSQNIFCIRCNVCHNFHNNVYNTLAWHIGYYAWYIGIYLNQTYMCIDCEMVNAQILVNSCGQQTCFNMALIFSCPICALMNIKF